MAIEDNRSITTNMEEIFLLQSIDGGGAGGGGGGGNYLTKNTPKGYGYIVIGYKDKTDLSDSEYSIYDTPMMKGSLSLGSSAVIDTTVPAGYEGSGIAVGYQNMVIGPGSYQCQAFGNSNTINAGNATFVTGYSNKIGHGGSASFIAGQNNSIYLNNSSCNFILGQSNTLFGCNQNVILGYGNEAYKSSYGNVIMNQDNAIDEYCNYNMISGYANQLKNSCSYNIIGGNANKIFSSMYQGLISGYGNKTLGNASQCMITGNENKIVNSYCGLIGGSQNKIVNNGTEAIIIGDQNLVNNAYCSLTFGQYNNVGFNSGIPNQFFSQDFNPIVCINGSNYKITSGRINNETSFTHTFTEEEKETLFNGGTVDLTLDTHGGPIYYIYSFRYKKREEESTQTLNAKTPICGNGSLNIFTLATKDTPFIRLGGFNEGKITFINTDYEPIECDFYGDQYPSDYSTEPYWNVSKSSFNPNSNTLYYVYIPNYPLPSYQVTLASTFLGQGQWRLWDSENHTWTDVGNSLSSIGNSTGSITGGYQNQTSGSYSAVFGQNNHIQGDAIFVAGHSNTVTNLAASAFGKENTVSANCAHAEGWMTTASAVQSHAEGQQTTASGNTSHAEGFLTTASNEASHAEGYRTTASGYSSHAEGEYTIASGGYSHAEGNTTTASGYASHSEGSSTSASGYYSHADGVSTKVYQNCSYVGGSAIENNGECSFAYGKSLTYGGGSYSIIGHWDFSDWADSQDDEKQYFNTAKSITSLKFVLDDYNNIFTKMYISSYGGGTGWYDQTTGELISGNSWNVSGLLFEKTNNYIVTASLSTSLELPDNCYILKAALTGSTGYGYGISPMLEEYRYAAEGQTNTVFGSSTQAIGSNQTVIGRLNIKDNTKSFIIGNGSIEYDGTNPVTRNRSNALTVDWDGNQVLAGKLTVGAAPTNNMDVTTKQYVDNIRGNNEGLVANQYSSSSTYTVGSYVIYNHTLYICTTPVTVAEDFDDTKWTAIKLADKVATLDNDINNTSLGLKTRVSNLETQSYCLNEVSEAPIISVDTTQIPLGSDYDADSYMTVNIYINRAHYTNNLDYTIEQDPNTGNFYAEFQNLSGVTIHTTDTVQIVYH